MSLKPEVLISQVALPKAKLDRSLSEQTQKQKEKEDEKLRLLIERMNQKEGRQKPIFLDKAIVKEKPEQQPTRITTTGRTNRNSAPTPLVSSRATTTGAASTSRTNQRRPAPLFAKAMKEALAICRSRPY